MPLTRKSNIFFQKLKKYVVLEKLYNPVGIGILILFSVFIALGISKFGILFGALFIVTVISIPCVYAIVVYPKFGIIFLLIMAYMLFMLWRLGINGPVGIIMDVLQVLLIIGVIRRQRKERNWAMLKGPISTMIIVWIIYNVLEVANPSAEARQAWLYTIRTVAVVMLSYFVFLYNIRTIKFVRLIFIVWLFMSTFAAIYGLKQEYIGFSDLEDAYLHSDPAIAGLLFIAGHWRKFSIFSDPVAFAYNMTMSTIFCIAIIAGKFSRGKKIICGILIFLFQLSSLYSGTRGANVLIPAALLLFAILNYNPAVLKATIVAAIFLVLLINVPTSNKNILRFQTAFRPNNDPSYLLRKANQKRIQPYIWTHPMGGGLGATGTWGQRFAPNSFLANFPPDSGYIRVAVELGWIGLTIFCLLMFTALKTGINNYYTIKDPELKTYCLAMTLIIFAYNIANFPQEALVQFPSNVYFSLEMAMLTVLLRLDKEKQEQQRNTSLISG